MCYNYDGWSGRYGLPLHLVRVPVRARRVRIGCGKIWAPARRNACAIASCVRARARRVRIEVQKKF
jgi:hypothetical protein